jgi:TRAP-type C4-dicarboxylate transport system substrate-binding protein
MLWNELTEESKALVFEALAREAVRLENEAVHLEQAAKQLGRPSLVERTELRANAFRAAIEALGGEAVDEG